MKKKVLASILVASMAMSMVACGGNDAPAANNDAPAGTEAAGTADKGEEPVTVKMWFHGSNVTDDTEVMAAVNDYLLEKLNIQLEPIWGTWGDFDEKATYSLQGSEDVDIYFTCSWSKNEYNRFARDGYYVRLDDPSNNLIEQYASELWSQLPEVLTNGAKITGSDGVGVYAVPGYKDIATQNCWDVNVDRLEDCGFTLDDVAHIDYFSDEFKNILQTAKDKYGADFYPLLVEGAVLERMVTNSIIVTGDSGDGNFMSYYLDPTDVSQPSSYGNKIVNKFATPEFKAFAEKTHEYYEAGFINPADALKDQANDNRTKKQASGEYLIGTQSYSLGYELQASQERGIHVEMIPCTDAYVDTTSSQGAMMAISTASKHPAEAMQLLNLLNTDPKLMTMLNYGLEGTQYNMVDGCVNFMDETGEEMLPGRQAYMPWTNGVGNVTILPPTVDQGKDFWQGFKDYYGNAKEIPVLGYAYDSSSVATEMGTVATVIGEYALSLCTGSVDPDEVLPVFLSELEANGINTVLDDANAQLDAFMAEK